MTAAAETECLADRLAVGDVVGEKYRVDAILGRGGMGMVVAAEHLQLKERVALKFLTSAADRVPAARSRFMREARVTAKLRGEHAARVSDFGTLDDGTPYMVMEFLDGIDLRKHLRQQGRLPVEIAIHYIVQACEGLAEAHALGIVHRDLKPSNLFLTKRPDGTDLIKIVDFGVSKMRSAQDADDDITAAGSILGSPRYVAPEQLRNSGEVDARADVWSLGAILYELLSGYPPFAAESTAALCYLILSDERPERLVGHVEGVSEPLEAAVMRCLTRDRNSRTPNVAAVVNDLHDATNIEGLDAVAASIVGILSRPNADLGSTGTFGTSGSYPQTRPLRSLSSTDSGSGQWNEQSAGSHVGMARSQAPPRARSRTVWYVVGACALVAVGALAAWTQLPRDSVAGPVSATAVSPPPPPFEQPPATHAGAPDAAASANTADAATEPSGLDAGPAATNDNPGSRWTGTRTHPRPPDKEEPKPPGDENDPKKRDPFGDRY